MIKLNLFNFIFLYHIMEVLKPSNVPYFTEKKEPRSLKHFSKILEKKKKDQKRTSKKKRCALDGCRKN